MDSTTTSSYKRSLLLIFAVVFFDLLAFGIVIPILPYYARHFDASGVLMGWLMTSYSLMQFLFSPFWGQLSDRVGRRPILVMSVAGSALSMVILGFAQSLVWLFVARIFSGIFAANISTATAYIADISPEEKRAASMGIIGAAFGLGFIFGPAVGGYFAQYGYSVPMFIAAGLALVNSVFIFFKLPEPQLSKDERKSHRREISFKTLRETLNRPRLARIVCLFFLVTVAFVHLEVIFAFFVKDQFNYGPRQAGYLLALVGVIIVIIQGGLIGKLSKKFGELRLIIIGPVLMGFGLIYVPFAAHLGMGLFIGTLALVAIGNALNNPSLMSLASKSAARGEVGSAMGIYQSAGSMARILGPLSAGWLYDHVSRGAPFQTAGVIMGLAVLLAITLSSAGLAPNPHAH